MRADDGSAKKLAVRSKNGWTRGMWGVASVACGQDRCNGGGKRQPGDCAVSS